MLGVQSHRAVLENNQVEGFIEPPVAETNGTEGVQSAALGLRRATTGPRGASGTLPVVAFAVEEALGVAVQGLDRVVGVVALLRVVQGDDEGRLLDGVQRQLVLSAAEVGVASVGPRGSAKTSSDRWSSWWQ